MRMARLKEGNE